MNEWVPGYRASNRAYLHNARHRGPQLSEGPTRNRQNCNVNRVLRHRVRATFRWTARGRFQSTSELGLRADSESTPQWLAWGILGVLGGADA